MAKERIRVLLSQQVEQFWWVGQGNGSARGSGVVVVVVVVVGRVGRVGGSGSGSGSTSCRRSSCSSRVP